MSQQEEPEQLTVNGIWMSQAEIAALPITGEPECDPRCAAAWNYLASSANLPPTQWEYHPTVAPDISDQDEVWGQYAMAKAFVWARTGNTAKRDEVFAILEDVINTEQPGIGPHTENARSLAIGRELASYVLAADIIDLTAYNPAFDQDTFRPWIDYLLTRINKEGRSLETCHQIRPNNWGSHCGASRTAVALYLLAHETDPQILARAQSHFDNAVTVFRGWLGDRSAYAGFSFQDDAFTWMPDPSQPRPINPAGAIVQGHNVDGVNTDDQQRAAPNSFHWPPNYTVYAYGGFEGASVIAEMLSRQGHDAWNWSDRATQRFVEWMWYTDGQKAVWDTCNDTDKRFILDIVDRAYHTSYIERMSCYTPTSVSRLGRNVAWTSWTHQPARIGIPPDTELPTVVLTAPEPNATVSGTVPVRADAADNVAVAGVTFKVDGVPVAPEDTSFPYEVPWNTATVANGPHALTAIARDTSQNTNTSPSVSVTVANVGDTIAPTVSITAPQPNATVSGRIDVTADATDNVGVIGVQFKLDGQDLGSEDPVAPYSVSWDTRTASNGSHTLTAVARDGANNATTSAPVGVTVENAAGGVPVTVLPTVETGPAHHSGDTADDSAIWIHPSNPSQSVIIGDDKDGGIMVWDLAGTEIQYLDGSRRINNLDLRYNVPLTGTFSDGGVHTRVALVGANDEAGNRINFYKVNPTTRFLESVGTISTAAWGSGSDDLPYGSCMYHSPVSGKYYYFVNNKNGEVQQWELLDAGGGQIGGAKVREFAVGDGIGDQTEGCVADDVLQKFYIGEEDVAVWKYGAEPSDGTARTEVDRTTVQGGQRLVADIEGMAISYTDAVTGYLIVSSQGNDTLYVYEREGANSFVGSFKIGANGSIDAVTDTDGLDTVSFSIGGGFPEGVFIAHDSPNSGASGTNHKLVPWDDVREALNLATGGNWDPRLVGAAPDMIPPTVSITAPEPNATVSGTISVTANASDNIGVIGVQFKLDGQDLGSEDPDAPYEVMWNTTTTPNAPHVLTAVARDGANNATTSAAVNVTVNNDPPTPQGGAPDPNLKVAFIGDQGANSNSSAVLQLIEDEGVDFVMHQGDFDYANNATAWENRINQILGPDFPYFASVGNHDIGSWPDNCSDPDGCYAQKLKDRMARLGVTIDDPNLNDQMYSMTYRGLKLVFVGQSGVTAGDNTYAPYIQQQLSGDNQIWKICSWHKNQNRMQIGGKGDEMGWRVYENCKDLGALIATAHEHSYERTKTLTSMQNQTVDTTQHPLVGGIPQNPNNLKVGPGKSFVFVSGLGGESKRAQTRCLPTTYPYGGGTGCNYLWDKIYTQGPPPVTAQYGALFITFHVDGDPHKARGYFKNINGEVIDQFEIVNENVGGTSPDTTPPTVSITAPAPDATVSGTISVTATATDDVGVVGVQFKLDGQDLGAEDFFAPFSVPWDTTTTSDGSHTLTAVARDRALNIATSAPVPITVANNVPDTTPPFRSQGAPSGTLPSGTTNVTLSLTTNEAATCRHATAAGTPFGSMTQTFTTTNGTAHSTALSGLSDGQTYTYYVRCQDNANNANPDDYAITFTVAAPSACLSSTNSWRNASVAAQTGSFTLEYDATPNNSPMDGVTGLSNGNATGYTSLAVIPRFNPSGRIDARNGGAYAASTVIPYTAGTPYHFRVVGDIASHTYNTYVTPAGSSEITIGTNFAFRTEQASVATLNNLGLYANSGTHQVCNLAIAAGGQPPDTTSPTVAITAPASNATVSGTISVTANASDNIGVIGVQFKLDGQNLGAEDPQSPYAVSWNTITASNGPHALTAVARDGAGNDTTSSAIAITVSNPTPDTTPPTVSLTAPTPGQTVSGTITVSANASDNVGVSGVQFKLDGQNLGAEDPSAPYLVSWNTTAAANGGHTLTAVARDGANNTTTSTPVSVTVANTQPDTTPPVIANIQATNLTTTGAKVLWTTDEASSSQVEYGLTTAYGQTTPDDLALVTSHTVQLSDLTANTTYHFRVRSRDGANNAAVSGDQTFATPERPSSCVEDWSCTDFSVCRDGEQTRECIDRNQCGTTNTRPALSQPCSSPPPEGSCSEDWTCTEYTACANGTQTRACTDRNVCGTTSQRPALSRSCETGGPSVSDRERTEILTGPAAPGAAHVKHFTADGRLVGQFFAFPRTFRGGTNIASGDVDGDGVREIIVGTGPASAPHVRVFTASGSLHSQYFAFPRTWRTGSTVVAADLNGDGRDEVVVAPNSGAAHIRVFAFDTASRRYGLVVQRFVYATTFRGGVNLAAGDLNGDGRDEIITAPAQRGGPHVRIFSYRDATRTLDLVSQFFAFPRFFSTGVSVAVGDFDGDGNREVATGAGPRQDPVIRFFTPGGRHRAGFLAAAKTVRSGFTVATVQADEDANDELVFAPWGRGRPTVSIVNVDRNFQRVSLLKRFNAYAVSVFGGIRLGTR